MPSVIIDTSIYRQDPWRKRVGFKTIERLATTGRLRVHIPYLVQREFVSQQIAEYEKQLDAIQRGISSLRRKRLPDDLSTQLEELENQFEPVRDQVIQHLQTEFDEWARSIGAVLHPIAESHGGRVIDDYFEGAPPFQQKKNRNDIPDAFVWQVITDLLEELGELIVIAGDDGLLDACAGTPGITAFRSLDEFSSSDACRHLLRETNIEHNLESLRRVLPTRTERLERAVDEQLTDRLYGYEVISPEIPEDNHEAKVSGVYEPDLIEFDVDSIQYYGYGSFVIPFQVWVKADLWYTIFKADYYTLSPDEATGISVSDWNDHYFEAEEEYSLYVRGNVSVEVDLPRLAQPELNDLEIEELIRAAEVSIDSITEVEVETEDW